MHRHHPMKPFAIPADWTAEQAMAVVDLLDDLRQHLWAKYELALTEAYRECYAPETRDDEGTQRCDDERF